MANDEEPTALGEGHEFDAIRLILERLGDRARGVGDDAAVIPLARGERLVVSVDAAVEGVHFQRGWLTPREIGYRAVAAALSDLAAMGARPVGVLLALAIPADWRDSVGELADGIGDAVARVATHVVGGNMTRAPVLSITTTVLGHVHHALRRSAMHVGDRIYLTGRLGGPSLALDAWNAGREPEPGCRARFAAPTPRVGEARWLAAAGATAAIDLSDGLVSDLGHLALASRVRLVVHGERIPCQSGVDPLRAMRSGEEYELVVGSPVPIDVGAFHARFGVELTEIGAAIAGAPGVEVWQDGTRVAPPHGHDHFSG